MHDPHRYLTIAAAADQIRAGRLSPVDLVEAALDRIARIDPRLHSFITVTGEEALAQARTARDEIAAGRWRGPMHGIPIGLKDIVWTRGVPTTAHSNVLRDWVPDEDGTVAIRLREAGAISLGKNSLLEFAYGTPGPDEAFAAPRNPWNLEYAPGGSSSGSGAAVAAGLVMGSVGTDTGGSIRHPSAVTGCVGMKPTFGRVSQHGVIPVSLSLDHIGPMTRTVRDNALMLAAMAGHDPRDPNSAAEPVPDFHAATTHGVAGMTIGVPESLIASVPHHPEVAAAFARALDVLRELGARIVPIEIPGATEAHAASTPVLEYEAYHYHRERLAREPQNYGAKLRDRILAGQRHTRADYEAALVRREALKRSFAQVFDGGADLVVTPGREMPAVTMTQFIEAPMAARGAFTRIYNFTGLPSLVMPMGFTSDVLPLSVQFTARWFGEPLIYRAACAYEDATPWHDRHPSL
jgi:aspartyl-tRNA(Asn)/glutamyl-tRNA(Gln) amidotransferase subunit A